MTRATGRSTEAAYSRILASSDRVGRIVTLTFASRAGRCGVGVKGGSLPSGLPPALTLKRLRELVQEQLCTIGSTLQPTVDRGRAVDDSASLGAANGMVNSGHRDLKDVCDVRHAGVLFRQLKDELISPD